MQRYLTNRRHEMISSLFRRQGIDLLARCTLLVSCFLLSGCVLDKLIHPEAYLQRPGILIIVSPDSVKDGKVDYTLDADTVEISGVRMGDLLGKAESWRVNLFQGGNRVSGMDGFEVNRNNRII